MPLQRRSEPALNEKYEGVEMTTIRERIQRFGTYDLLRKSVIDSILQARDEQRVCIFVNTPIEAEKWRRYIADNVSTAAFKTDVMTFTDFVKANWVLFGDDRRIVDDAHRTAAIAYCLQHANFDERYGEGDERFSPTTRGSVEVLSKAAKELFYHEGVDDTLRAKAEEHKVGAVRTLLEYSDLLKERRFIEPGEAIWLLLANAELMRREDVYAFVGTEYLLPAEEEFAVRSNALAVELDPVGDSESPGIPQLAARLYSSDGKIDPSEKICFAYSSGPNAEIPLLASIIEEILVANPNTVIRVADSDAQDLYLRLSPVLGQLGISSRSLIEWDFRKSDAGRAFSALNYGFRKNRGVDRLEMLALLFDYASGPFCKCSIGQARSLDKEAKEDRSITYEDYIRRLTVEDGGIGCKFTRQMLGLLQSGDLEGALKALYYKAIRIKESNARTFSSSLHGEINVTLAKKAWESAKYLKDYELSPDIQEDIIMSMDCYKTESSVGVDGAVRSEASVEFTRFLGQPYDDVDVCVVTRMDSDGMPAASDGDPIDFLFAYLGLEREDRIQKRLRDSFKRTLLQTRDRIVFHANLHDAESAPIRAGILLEEVYDSLPEVPPELLLDQSLGYRETDGFVPARARYYQEQSGSKVTFLSEDDLGLLGIGSKHIETESIPGIFKSKGFGLSETGRLNITTRAGADMSYSASAMESYLNCPYQWFASYPIRVDSFEAENDARSRGSFVHAVLELTYCTLFEKGEARVTPSNLIFAQQIMNEAFNTIMDDPDRFLPEGALVIQTMLDKYRIEELREPLMKTLEMDSSLFPSFRPMLLEEEYFDENAADYAGHKFVGKIDRVDVDESGNAIVIDYKGSAAAAYSPRVSPDAPDEGMVVQHPQALIYASMVQKRHPELKVVGAVYHSYRKAEIAGLIDCTALPADEIGDVTNRCFCWHERTPIDLESPLVDRDEQASITRMLDATRCMDIRSCASFGDALDACELLISKQIERLQAGYVDPCVLNDDSCRYCPVARTCDYSCAR